MKHISTKKQLLLAACSALLVLNTGCIRESLDACPAHKLTVKVVNTEGADFTESSGERIEEVTVFIFNESLEHLSTHHMSVADVQGRRKIDLPYPEGAKIRAIAWGNAYAGNQNVSEGDLVEQLKVMLKKEQEQADMPDELYYGKENILTKAAEVETVDTVTIKIKVGALRVYTENMPEKYLSSLKSGEESKLYINRTLSTWNHDGTLEGDSVYYMPDPTINEPQTELDTKFHNYATGQAMNVVLELPDGDVKQEFVNAENGEPIEVYEGKETEVVIRWGEDGTYLGARVIVREWGYIDDPTEW